MAAWLRNHARQLAVKMTAQKHAEQANPGVAYARLLHLSSALMSALLVFVVACGATRVVPARFFTATTRLLNSLQKRKAPSQNREGARGILAFMCGQTA